jgi:hypothetical protein
MGDTVRVEARLPSGLDYAKLSVWSATPGYDLSPHVPIAAMGALKDGKPVLVTPMRFNLNDVTKSKVFEFVADEDLLFRICQEKDVPEELSAKVKVKRYGKTYQKVRSGLRNAVRTVRRYAKLRGWHNQ